ncbi:tripartite motif-containing protein 16-like [Colossoma macropomum]|uniref:tripartite motif-containing protein 16-like n=1 Tax=Colossoma macropomum TaxID=42526 RepID=UPI0018646AF4|nr:tripartite motif-containing protein 16-like [Colossoma macropomum]
MTLSHCLSTPSLEDNIWRHHSFSRNETNQCHPALVLPASPLSSSMEEMGEEPGSQCPDFSTAGPPDVECDACVGRKRKAEQSCLECVASYCEAHLDLHNTLHAGKRHKLVEATERLQERTCPEHGKLLEVFCRTDQRCICHLCITDTHRTHDVISIEVEVAEKKIQLEKMQRKTTERIQTREMKWQELRRAVETFKMSAEEAVAENDRLFTELIHSMEKRQCAVKGLILAQKEAVIKQVEELIENVQQQITELKKRHDELQHLEQLFQEHNNIQFLESVCSISQLTKAVQIPVLLVHPYCSFEPATDAVSELLKELNLNCQWQFITISERVKNTGIVSSPLPRTRQELLKYASKLTLDPNTVHDNIRLSLDNMLLTAVRESEYYPFHSQRFERRLQALCQEGLRGSPRYWEVKCGTKGRWVSIAVSYKGIRRTGKHAPLFGRCQSSWALRKYGSYYAFWHGNKETYISSSLHGSTIGVYLDHGAGVLAFYNVSDNTSLIHKVQTKFTEPVYAGFGLVGIGSQIKLCDLDSQD